MDGARFKEIISSFSDASVDVDLTKGKLLMQVRDEIIEATVHTKEGNLVVTENGDTLPATRWLVKRVARLPLLADRILSYIPAEPNFVVPSGFLDKGPADENVRVSDALNAAKEMLDQRPAGVSSVLYLTSDGGEGKTTLINQLARQQAELYKQRKTDWLLLPIPLGGRTFLRFDDIVVGALVNRLRFQLLYFEGFVELVRLGVIVPAFDGFEEMFIENPSGDAVSALGNLMQTMKSEGSLLIAARKAYYEYSSLSDSSTLFDALGSISATFSKLRLNRWDRLQFLDYCKKRDVPNGEEIYNDVSLKFNCDHPLLTRAVLVHRLLDVAASSKDRQALLDKLNSEPQKYFEQFVSAIITREVDKWIDKSGDLAHPARPLLTFQEHFDLLSMIAQEMWASGSASLRVDLLDTITRLFCDKQKKDASISRQVMERIKQHALIVLSDPTKQLYSFDHEEFYHYFLGEALGTIIKDGSAPDLRLLVRTRALPRITMDVAVHCLGSGDSTQKVIESLVSACVTDDSASFSKENCGGLIVRLLDGGQAPWGKEKLVLKGAHFPPDALVERKIVNVQFVDCYFQGTSLKSADITTCIFDNCDLERLEIETDSGIKGTKFSNSRIRCIVTEGASLFDPDQIAQLLIQKGATVSHVPKATPQQIKKRDVDLVLFERILRVFLRATDISDSTIRQKLGKDSNHFSSDILPELLKSGAMRLSDYHGGGTQRYYRLGPRLQEVKAALEKSLTTADFIKSLAKTSPTKT